ncbi:MAG: tetratricopeptide repeat protein [Anaerolineae bacterium]|nr:tetratricopeptide repeat protein [Anaerolineae bacterium]
MSNLFAIGRPSANEADVLVGDAWSKHFNGQNDAALEQFRKLAERYSDHIDANYGLALCLKAAGQKDAAIGAFSKAKQLCQSELEKKPDEPDRYMMILRMCDQSITLLGR